MDYLGTRVYSLDGTGRVVRARLIIEKPPVSTRAWLGICCAVAAACGFLGWALGRVEAEWSPYLQSTDIAQTTPTTRVSSPDVTNLPFGGSLQTARVSGAPWGGAAPAQTLPFAFVRAWIEDGKTAVVLERDGRSFVARGTAVHGDYLVQVDRAQIVFTLLSSADRQSIAVPPGSWSESPTLQPPAPVDDVAAGSIWRRESVFAGARGRRAAREDGEND